MKAKLSKDKDGSYTLSHHPSGWGIGSTNHEWVANHKGEQIVSKLSLENCQAIERGYDLEELAENKWNELSKQLGLSIQDKAMWCGGFKHGLLKLLGDKKYSEEDMMNIYILGGKYKTQKTESFLDKGNEIIQSLQQTEWEVIVEMEDIQEIHIDGVLTLQPKLDVKNCLILKRI